MPSAVEPVDDHVTPVGLLHPVADGVHAVRQFHGADRHEIVLVDHSRSRHRAGVDRHVFLAGGGETEPLEV